MTTFIRALDVEPDKKAHVLKDTVAHGGGRMFSIEWETFSRVPDSAFVYWLPDTILSLFKLSKNWANFEARCGLGTLDDYRFLRLWHELRSEINWVPFVKGGKFSPFLPQVDLQISWHLAAAELKAFVEQKVGNASRKVQSQKFYFREGVTWARLPHIVGSFQIMPSGCVFSDGGPAVFGQSRKALLALNATTNSSSYLFALDSLMARGTEGGQTLKYEAGYVTSAPLPKFDADSEETLARLASRGWAVSRKLATGQETSLHFVSPLTAQQENRLRHELLDILREVDQELVGLFEINEVDGEIIAEWIGPKRTQSLGPQSTLEIEAERRLSWTIGVAFGRFDIRLATGERAIPSAPDPFDPLPAKSPGMAPDGDAPFMPTAGIFVDDPGHPDDLTARAAAVYERVGEAPPAPDDLRRNLAKDFFPAHIRMYSKSRRKAPIYWQLATPSASYSVWLYIHAFSKDTLLRVQNDYVAPKLAHERRELDGLLAEAGATPTTAQGRAIETQQAFVEELSAMLDEVRRVAPLWDPDLDDGVILNFAPLWRLVPQNRAWQKELKVAWASLLAGDYDWAHLAMRLWPERVVPKCAKDRSLAIAHYLEDTFWFQDSDGKWQPGSEPTRPMDALIAERTSAAVKAALTSLNEAPDITGPARRGRRAAS